MCYMKSRVDVEFCLNIIQYSSLITQKYSQLYTISIGTYRKTELTF